MGETLSLLILGMVQGLTDIFPISSTGHLALFCQVLNYQLFNLPLAVGLHSGSLVAIAIYFRKEIMILWKNLLESLQRLRTLGYSVANISSLSPENQLPYRYAISLLPVAIEGLTLRTTAQRVFEQELIPVVLLMVNGAIILVTALLAHGERSIKELTWREFLFLGAIQGVAVLPGISRLGIVLCMGLLYRLKWQEALKLTFVLSIPVVIGALFVEAGSIVSILQFKPDLIASFLLGSLLAGLGSWFSLKLFNSPLLERRKLNLFGYYCLMLGSFFSLFLYFWN